MQPFAGKAGISLFLLPLPWGRSPRDMA